MVIAPDPRHGCRNQNCASAPVVAWPTRKSQSCMLSAFSKRSLPALRWGNSRPTHRGTWPVATASYHRPNHSSEFCIGSCQCLKTSLYRKTNVYKRLSYDERIKIHHSCSCKQSAVHTRWRHLYLTIDMFKFTDVTASHVYSASFCPFFHISVTVQKLTQDRTIRAYINQSISQWFLEWPKLPKSLQGPLKCYRQKDCSKTI